MISKCKRLAAAGMIGVMLLSSASCGIIEMRESSTDIVKEEETAVLRLEPAERKNTVETRCETEVPVAEEPAAALKVCLTGDIRVDDHIIRDAANRAAEGKSYSFVRMFAGVFRSVCSADISFGSYSAADVPVGSESGKKTPVESLAALSDIGFDLLDTTGTECDAAEMEEYGIANLNGESNIRYAEENGITVAFVSGDGADSNAVKTADETADAVVVSVNWNDGVTSEECRTIAYDLALAGADVIVGDGRILGGVEYIDTGDNTPVIAAYSLGSLIATSDAPYELCGGILEFTVTEGADGCEISDAVLMPSVVRYTEGYNDYQLVMLDEYGYDLSADHAVSGVNPDVLLPFVRQTVNSEFLDPDLRG